MLDHRGCFRMCVCPSSCACFLESALQAVLGTLDNIFMWNFAILIRSCSHIHVHSPPQDYLLHYIRLTKLHLCIEDFPSGRLSSLLHTALMSIHCPHWAPSSSNNGIYASFPCYPWGKQFLSHFVWIRLILTTSIGIPSFSCETVVVVQAGSVFRIVNIRLNIFVWRSAGQDIVFLGGQEERVWYTSSRVS